MPNNFKINQDVWVNNISDLFKKEYLLQFFPSTKYNCKENINSIMRFALYISVILSIVYKNIYFMMIVVVVAISTYIYITVYRDRITEFFETDLLKNKMFVKEVKSDVNNPLQNKLIGEDNKQYQGAYLSSNENEITDNILHIYKKLDNNKNKAVTVHDTLNKKETLLNLYPLPDKTGIPDFAKFAKNTYGTSIENRSELVKRGFISKADTYRLEESFERINYDPIGLTVQ